MLMALEDSIGIVIDPEDLDAEDFETVDTFVRFALFKELMGTAAQG